MHTFKLTAIMRVLLYSDKSTDTFSKHLLDIGNGTFPTDTNTRTNNLLNGFCRIMDTKEL